MAKFNFNTSKKKDYKTQANMINELINLYGVSIKLLLVEKIGKDDLVFGDYSHLKTVPGQSYEISGLPENSDSWDDVGINYSEFGMINTENIRLFFSRKTIDTIFGEFDSTKGFGNILGNIIVLPNNKIMEITDIDFQVPGINNLFTNNDIKSAYKFTCKTYDMKLINEISNTEIIAVGSTDTSYDTLDKYFNELTNVESEIDTEAEITIDTNTTKTIISIDEDTVFGRF